MSVISWMSAFQGCPLRGVPLYLYVSYNTPGVSGVSHKIHHDVPETSMQKESTDAIVTWRCCHEFPTQTSMQTTLSHFKANILLQSD